MANLGFGQGSSYPDSSGNLYGGGPPGAGGFGGGPPGAGGFGGSLAPPSLNGMYGSGPPGAGGFGGSSVWPQLGAGPNPFAGFDTPVPGKEPFPNLMGPGPPSSGSFVAMAPPPSNSKDAKEGSFSGGTVRFSDKKNDQPGHDAQPSGESGKGGREDRMDRASRDEKPRVLKKKAER